MEENMLGLPYNITCGFCDCSEFPPNMKKSSPRELYRFEIELYLENGFITYVDGKECPVKENYIVLAKPGQYRNSVLPFKTQWLKFQVDGEIAKILRNAPDYFYAIHSGRIKETLKEISLILEEETENNLRLYSKILSVLNIIVNDSKAKDRTAYPQYEISSKAKRYINEHFAEEITLETVAAAVNMSKTYLHTLFINHYGITPHKYLLEQRISAAKVMLWNSDNSLDIIAEKCGFASQQYFSYCFKRETGMTPLKYRMLSQEKYLL